MVNKKYNINKTWLEDQYKKKTMREIADILGSSVMPIRQSLEKFNMPKRHVGFQKGHKRVGQKQGQKQRIGYSSSQGYRDIYNPTHPGSTKHGYVVEHRLIIEKEIKHYIKDNEVIHHINGVKSDNRIENLFLCKDIRQHTLIHRQLERISINLYNKGIVNFNHINGEYYVY